MYRYAAAKIVALPAEPPLVCRSASDAKVRESGRAEVKPRYREEFVNCGMSVEHARFACRRSLANGKKCQGYSNPRGARCADRVG